MANNQFLVRIIGKVVAISSPALVRAQKAGAFDPVSALKELRNGCQAVKMPEDAISLDADLTAADVAGLMGEHGTTKKLRVSVKGFQFFASTTQLLAATAIHGTLLDAVNADAAKDNGDQDFTYDTHVMSDPSDINDVILAYAEYKGW